MHSSPRFLTVGHSTRPINHFLELLAAHVVVRIVDVRAVPESRRHPQFGKAVLVKALAEMDIGYTHMPELGGLRRPKPGSINTAWRNEYFRGYADYMQTPHFAEAIQKLLSIGIADTGPLALMCAEASPSHCHRSLIADALLVRGILVENILSPTNRVPHALTTFARVQGTDISYPGTDARIDDLFG